MFSATLTHHLARVKRGAAGACNAMGPGRLTDGIAALQARTTPDVYSDTPVHMLVVDCKFQRIAGDVLFVATIELDRQRIHLREPLDRQAQESAIVFEIGPDIGIKVIEREGRVTRNGLRIPIEIHQNFASHPGLAIDRKIDKTGPEVEHSRGMKRPLIALAENIGDEFLRGSIVIAQEIVLDAIGIDGMDVRQALRVCFRQIPG